VRLTSAFQQSETLVRPDFIGEKGVLKTIFQNTTKNMSTHGRYFRQHRLISRHIFWPFVSLSELAVGS